MLFALYPTIAQNYFILCFVVSLGALQWTAARNRKPDVSLLGQWGLGSAGQTIGGLLVVGGFIWFLGVTPRLFQTGLAGGELSTLFGTAGLTALGTTRLGALLGHKLAQSRAGIFTPE